MALIKKKKTNCVESFASLSSLVMRSHSKGCTSPLSFNKAKFSQLALPSCELLLQNTSILDAIFPLYNPFTLLLPGFNWVAYHRFSDLDCLLYRVRTGAGYGTAGVYSFTELVIRRVAHPVFSVYCCRYWFLGSSECNDLFCKRCLSHASYLASVRLHGHIWIQMFLFHM